MCFGLFKRDKDFKNKYIFWDTNCYRLLGLITNAKGTVWLEDFLRKLKKAENNKGIDVKVSYLVLAEMFAHLDEDIDSNNYTECKHGLFAALFHSNFDVNNLLHNADNEFVKFITGKATVADAYRESSLYTVLLQINSRGFNDDFIKGNYKVVQLAKTYLQTIKDNWKDSFISYFIKKHDPAYTGNWQVLMSDEPKRKTLLSELRKANRSNSILNDFGIGMYEYVKNNITGTVMPDLNNALLSSIIVRFNPLFDLQYRILDFMCQSGYNLDAKQNDITDYLIVANLEPRKSLFVSNESKNLVPNLHSQGYKNDVWLLDKYFKKLSISYN